MTKLVILDRDGVINHDSDAFIKSPAEWRPIAGSLEAIGRLSEAGYRVAIASNQSGVGRGLLSERDLEAIHAKMKDQVRQTGGVIDHIVYCPHRPDAGCDCRKPLPGLFHQLEEHYGMALDDVFAIGDSLRDLQAAEAGGATPLLVLTGNGEKTRAAMADAGIAAPVFDNLADAAEAIIEAKVQVH